MTPRERMIAALTWQPVDHPPHYEQMFELEREAFGLQFPDRDAWPGVTGDEKARLIDQCMAVYARIIETYRWDALLVFWPWSDPQGVAEANRLFGDRIMVGTVIGGALWAIETIDDWEQFALDLFENPANLHARAKAMCQRGLDQIDRLADAGSQFIHLGHDIAYNTGPFMSRPHFDEFILPYMARLVERVKSRGMFCIVHSDGNLMPVLDGILSTEPHALQSIDPMAGMDIAEVRRLTFGKMALMGNVRCDALQFGPIEAIDESARYCLEICGHGTGYIFSSSNTIFTGVPLAHYHRMLDTYRQFVDRLDPNGSIKQEQCA